MCKDDIIVTAMIVARNSEKVIEMSLKSLIKQDFPKNKYEILFIDSMSEDSTLDKAVKLLENSNQPYKILKNEKKTLASGWNMGIKAARGKYVTRIDAHVWAYPDFIKKSLKTINRVKDACCVGGKAETISIGKDGKVISKILSSPFGVGNSSFRIATTPRYTDTAACGLYKKEIFYKVGFFDESLKRSQDTELHARITREGYKFYFNPEIRIKYYARSTVLELLKQGWNNGYWNMHVWKKNKKALMFRHLIPLLFVCSLLVLLILVLLNTSFYILLIIEILSYLLISLYFYSKQAETFNEAIKMILITFMFHIMYGLGSLIGSINVFFNGGNL